MQNWHENTRRQNIIDKQGLWIMYLHTLFQNYVEQTHPKHIQLIQTHFLSHLVWPALMFGKLV